MPKQNPFEPVNQDVDLSGSTDDHLDNVNEDDPTLFVQYTGGASTRQILRTEWEKAGVIKQASTYWTIENRHLLPISDFTDTAIDALMTDGSFKVINADDVP